MRTVFHALVTAVVIVVVSAGAASAGSIKGRLGVTGHVGFLLPSDSEFTQGYLASIGSTGSPKLSVDGTFIGGGGLIFGITDNVAVEGHVMYSPRLEMSSNGVKELKLKTLDASLGLQVRSNVSESLTPYLDGGVDVLLSDVQDSLGNNGRVDTVVGCHGAVGFDYFMTKSFAINIDLRGLFFPEADIKGASGTVARFDPISFVGLFGFRYFIN